MKRLPWVSLVLLLVCYASFGWYLSGITTQPAWMKSACERILVLNGPQSAEAQEERSPPSPSSEPKPTVGEPNPAGQAETPSATQPEAVKPRKAYGQPDAEPSKQLTTPGSEAGTRQKPTSICDIIVRHNIHISLLAIAWILLSSMAFISPLTSFSSFVSRWFTSDTVAFLTIVTLAGMAAVILYWLHVFLQILTILAADALARIDMQAAGMSGIQAFWILFLVSLTGLVTGWLLNVFLV